MSDAATETFCQLLKEFCLAHGFTISGTCVSEGISGEITVCKVDDHDAEAFNFAYTDGTPVKES